MAQVIPWCVACLRRVFPPPNDRSVIFGHYVPLAGVVCHSLFAIQYMNPRYELTSLVNKNNLLTSLFISSNIGVGCYLFYGRRISRLSKGRRILYSVFLASLFTCGTVVVFDYVNQFLQDSVLVKATVGVSSSITLLLIGKKCLADIEGDPNAAAVDHWHQ